MHKLEKRVFVFLRDSKYSSFPFDFYSNLPNNYNIYTYLAYFDLSIFQWEGNFGIVIGIYTIVLNL